MCKHIWITVLFLSLLFTVTLAKSKSKPKPPLLSLECCLDQGGQRCNKDCCVDCVEQPGPFGIGSYKTCKSPILKTCPTSCEAVCIKLGGKRCSVFYVSKVDEIICCRKPYEGQQSQNCESSYFGQSKCAYGTQISLPTNCTYQDAGTLMGNTISHFFNGLLGISEDEQDTNKGNNQANQQQYQRYEKIELESEKESEF